MAIDVPSCEFQITGYYVDTPRLYKHIIKSIFANCTGIPTRYLVPTYSICHFTFIYSKLQVILDDETTTKEDGDSIHSNIGWDVARHLG